MKYLKSELKFESISEVLFFDIETVSTVKTIQDNPNEYESWIYKIKKESEYKELEKKDLNALEEYITSSYFEKAPLYFTFGKVATISLGYAKEGTLRIKEYKNENEKELLIEFFEDLDKLMASNKKFLCGFSVLGFDIPFIAFRAIVNDLSVQTMFDVAGLKPWNIKYCIDMKDLLASTAWVTPSLANCCCAMGLHSPKTLLSGDGVNSLYWSDDPDKLNKIATYCSQDVLAVANLFCKYIQIPILELYDREKAEAEKLANSDGVTQSFELPKATILQKVLSGTKLTKKDKDTLSKFLTKYDGTPELAPILKAIEFVNKDFKYTELIEKAL